MYHTIVIQCQTKNVDLICEDCIAYKTCDVHKNNQSHETEEEMELANFPVQCR